MSGLKITDNHSEKSAEDPGPYRKLTDREKAVLIANWNTADSWNSILVADGFDASLVSGCSFIGDVFIGRLHKGTIERTGLALPVGLSRSTFSNCVIGGNVAINQLAFCSNYVIGNEAVVHNVGELITGPRARFGNGADDENGNKTRWIHLINENGGRKIVPFEGITCSDAYIWSVFRDDEKLMDRFLEITRNTSSSIFNCPGFVGSMTIIRNVKAIRDCLIGCAAVVDSSEILENISISSDDLEPAFIGSGVQIRNSIIGFGARIESGAQLNNVITGVAVSISQTSRICDSFIGDNSVISCCEIANALILPSHAQHHNNSFLIATFIGGQSNIAAGATIGSNHNSRVNDGELWAARGFWPGLCASFKHNSRFASYTMSVKGSYPSELNIPFPFSLITNDCSQNRLLIYPAFWFTGNMYAFMRNRFKFSTRDKRIHKDLLIEHDPLAPDTIEEMFCALEILETLAGRKWFCQQGIDNKSDMEYRCKGHELFEDGTDPVISELEASPDTFERGGRKVILLKCQNAWKAYRDMILWYCATTIVKHRDIESLIGGIPVHKREKQWINCGGQIWNKEDLDFLIGEIKSGSSINTWLDIHVRYKEYSDKYNERKIRHVAASLADIEGIKSGTLTKDFFKAVFDKTILISHRIVSLTQLSRMKDYSDPFRTMVYSSPKEMEVVIGRLEDDSVIMETAEECNSYIEKFTTFISAFS